MSVEAGRDVGGELSWSQVLLRMLLVTVPCQVLGSVVALGLLATTGVLREHPGTAVLTAGVAGVVSGAGLGRLVTPPRRRLVTWSLAGAAVAVASYLLLLVASQWQLPDPAPAASTSAYLLAPALLGLAQTAVAVPIWLVRGRTVAEPSTVRRVGP